MKALLGAAAIFLVLVVVGMVAVIVAELILLLCRRFGLARFSQPEKSVSRKGGFVPPVVVGLSAEKARIYIQMLPSVLRKFEDKSSVEGLLPRQNEDSSTYKTMGDAIVDGQHIRARLHGVVVPENHLFIFGQSFEAALEATLRLVTTLTLKGTCDPAVVEPDCAKRCQGNEDDEQPNEEQSNIWAVTVCVVADRDGFERAFRNQKADDAEGQPHPYQCIRGPELDLVENRLREFSPAHSGSVASINQSGKGVD